LRRGRKAADILLCYFARSAIFQVGSHPWLPCGLAALAASAEWHGETIAGSGVSSPRYRHSSSGRLSALALNGLPSAAAGLHNTHARARTMNYAGACAGSRQLTSCNLAVAGARPSPKLDGRMQIIAMLLRSTSTPPGIQPGRASVTGE
jgi:hypothetical protein